MTKLLEQVEEMRSRLGEIAASEQTLVRALADALNNVDKKLLDDVRLVTAQHEARRGEILGELQSLAARICAFPLLPGPEPVLVEAEPALPPYEPRPAEPAAASPGDWRKAASRIQEELEYHFNGRAHVQ